MLNVVRALLTSLIMLFAGCSTPEAEDYAANKPTLDIRKYLNGDVEAWGMFVSSGGKVDPTFHVKLKGTWHGNKGTLTEHFEYSDGRKQDREWTLVFTDEHHFTGTAPDVIGTATGTQFGNAAKINYVLAVTTAKGTTHNMSMDDWLYQMDDNTVINRNVMTKFGIKAGELIITFRKKP
jgi:hypothetical protein